MTILKHFCLLLKPPLRRFCDNIILFYNDNVITSKAQPLHIPEINLPEFIWQNLDKWPDRTAITCLETGKSYTYAQLYKSSLSIAHFLRDSLKLERQDTVGVVLPNVPEYPIIVLGAVQAGLRVTTINAQYTSDEIRRQLENCKSKLVFTLSALLPVVREATTNPIVALGTNTDTTGTINFDKLLSKQGDNYIEHAEGNETVFLPYSSGTTGLPKGVELTHSSIITNLLQLTSPEFCIIPQESWKIPGYLPFCHIYGLVVILLQSFLQGATVIAMPKFSANHLINVLKEHKPDAIFGVPPIVQLLVQHPNITSKDLLPLRLITSGAAPLAPITIEQLLSKTHNKVKFLEGYGMTETSAAAIIQTTFLENGFKVGGSGFVLPNTQVKIIPMDGSTLQGLPRNQPGELVIKGPQVTKGYHNNPDATKSIFIDGWLRTGDLGYFDEHEHFFITGRLKEMIKVKGFQVAPSELEEVLKQHPRVKDCAVVGIPDSVSGEAPKAFVVANSPISDKELQDFVAKRVSKYKRLKSVKFVQAIPRTATGKILRHELQ
ncbi:4-coumarate--CoA ligase 1-like [Tribolium madens]|uniref:4-coumarate--CoA ligase 1-like n=1 Tax=Tribolium madens TaxID=41895 RepID=UPI001CF7447B|nr:4-coumarate--CoA ligase 1-like [Tribolium madens]